MSTTKTRVPVPAMPALSFPAAPYPSAGGRLNSTRLPTGTPTSATGYQLAQADLERRRHLPVVGVVEHRPAADLPDVVGDQPVTLLGRRVGPVGPEFPDEHTP